jgi:hypothetical protein
MLSVKSIIPKKINALYLKRTALSSVLVALFFTLPGGHLMAQDNSPYSRYGIGDLVPSTNVSSRGMAGIAAGYNDYLTINYTNPASYSSFLAYKEAKSNKLTSGRVILDVGMNFENRTLREPNNPVKFTASNALFSHVQVGMPLKKNLGLSFGLRPVSRISYKIGKRERLKDPLTGLPIDSTYTENTGDGGSYLATAGVGWKIFSKTDGTRETQFLSLGVNAGYFFGKKDYSTRRSFLNDTVEYYRGNFETRTTYGSLYFNAGLQYGVMLNNAKRRFLTIGAYGNITHKMDAKQDLIRETYYVDATLGNTQLDSVSVQNGVKGELRYPGSVTVGFVFEQEPMPGKEAQAGWLLGVDFSYQTWDNYLFYNQKDQLRNKWEVRVGGQFRPVPKKNYFSNIAYRAGLFMGPDYINVQKKLPQFGGSVGFGLPLSGRSVTTINQFTYINLAFEYIKRGNNDNLLKENMFRVSLGFSLSDLWFIKRKYE